MRIIDIITDNLLWTRGQRHWFDVRMSILQRLIYQYHVPLVHLIQPVKGTAKGKMAPL